MVIPWMSEVDIEAGGKWLFTLDDALKDKEVEFGIACLTNSNCNSTWIHYETGMLAEKKIAVCPYLIDLEPSDILESPLTQFQAKRADKTGTWELIHAINKSLEEGALPEGRLRQAFERRWPVLRSTLKKLSQNQFEERAQRNSEDMMRIIVESFRELAKRKPMKLPKDWKVTLTISGTLWTAEISDTNKNSAMIYYDEASLQWIESRIRKIYKRNIHSHVVRQYDE